MNQPFYFLDKQSDRRIYFMDYRAMDALLDFFTEFEDFEQNRTILEPFIFPNFSERVHDTELASPNIRHTSREKALAAVRLATTMLKGREEELKKYPRWEECQMDLDDLHQALNELEGFLSALPGNSAVTPWVE